MTEVISVKFKNRGKSYYFAPEGVTAAVGDHVIVETAKGLEFADCVEGNHKVPDESVVKPLRRVVRLATKNDLRIVELNETREQEAMAICRRKIEEHGLDMKLVEAEYSFEGNKIMFYFTSDGRVDFRELVKDLASEFRSRIELRQIGVRDEAKLLGGIGICGRPYCCSQFLTDFHPVSTKMAKVQSMSLNPTKISGACGRLMCCLRYEQEAYEELVKLVPKVGAFVETPAGYGVVTSVNMLRSSLKVRLDGEGDAVIKAYQADEIAVIPGGRPRPGEPLPQLLKDRPKPKREPEEPEEDPWALPQLFSTETYGEEPAAPEGESAAQKKRRSRRSRGGKKPSDAAPKTEAAKPAEPTKSEKPQSEKSSSSRNRRSRGGKKPQEASQKPEQKKQQPAPKPEQPAAPKAERSEGSRRPRRRGGRHHGKDSKPEGNTSKSE